MSTAEKANLARIRDNQRRSRARRKEYLQELEARLRQCELQGIEASAEIQLAARRVADENKKLRGLLSQNGVGEERVEAYLQTTPDLLSGGGYGQAPGSGSNSGSVQVLEQLLVARKYNSEGNTGAPGPITQTVGGTGSRDSSVTSMSTVQSMWDPPYSSQAQMRGSGESLNSMTGQKRAQGHQFMTPSSMASRTPSVGVSRSASMPLSQQQHHQQQHHQQQQQQQQHHQQQQHRQHQQQSQMSSLTPSMSSSISTAGSSMPRDPLNSHNIYDFDSAHALPQPLYHHAHAHSPLPHASHAMTHPAMRQQHQQQQQHSAQSQQHPSHAHHGTSQHSRNSHYIPVPASVAGTNSCVYATDVIATMAGADPSIVRDDLGCGMDVAGMDCQVDNGLVFNVLDRYSGSTGL